MGTQIVHLKRKKSGIKVKLGKEAQIIDSSLGTGCNSLIEPYLLPLTSSRIYRPSFRDNKPKTGSINSSTVDIMEDSFKSCVLCTMVLLYVFFKPPPSPPTGWWTNRTDSDTVDIWLKQKRTPYRNSYCALDVTESEFYFFSKIFRADIFFSVLYLIQWIRIQAFCRIHIRSKSIVYFCEINAS